MSEVHVRWWIDRNGDTHGKFCVCEKRADHDTYAEED